MDKLIFKPSDFDETVRFATGDFLKSSGLADNRFTLAGATYLAIAKKAQEIHDKWLEAQNDSVGTAAENKLPV